MFKGIQLFTFMTLFSLGSFANESVVNDIIQRCRELGGSYNVEGPTRTERDGGLDTCYKIKCSLSANADDVTVAQVEAAFPEGSGGFIGGWKPHCYFEEDKDPNDIIIDATTATSGASSGVSSGVTITSGGNGATGSNGVVIQGGGTISVNGETVTIGSGRWYDLCVKKNGEVRAICGGGSADYDITYSNGVNGYNGSNGSAGGNFRIVTIGNTRFRCAYYMSDEDCIGNDANIIIAAGGDATHCVDCRNGKSRGGAYGTLSGIAEVIGAVAPPLFGYLGTKAYSNAILGSNQAWAGAASVGFEQCQLMQSNYINTMYGYADASQGAGYLANNELPYQELSPPQCNGYNLGGFAGGMGFMGNGMGGFGNPYFAAGYSPGFLGGMAGPYGQYNPYGGMGMGMGGFGGGMGYPGFGGGMYGGGMGMGYPGMGGAGIGINIGLGGGMGMGGYPGMGGGIGMGYPGMGGGIGMGYPGMGGGMGMGYPGMGGGFGMGYPGMGGGINIGGGFGGGYPGIGGNIGGGFGMGGGGFGNPYGGGAGGYGLVPWGNGAGSYWNGSGGWGNGGYGNTGGYGQNWGSISQSYGSNQQAYMQDSYYQQAALQNSYMNSAQNLYSNGYAGGYGMGGYGSGYGSGYGYAPYAPGGNLGLSISGGFGFGF